MGDYTQFQNPTGIEMRGYVGTVNYAQSNKIVQFYKRAILNPMKSQEAGRPIHDNLDYVKIMTPGETLEIPDMPVREEHKAKWRQQWEQYINNQDQIPDGTPVDLLFGATDPAMVANLRSRNIHTVEQLANLSADGAQSFMGAQTCINKAKVYLEQSNKGVTYHKFQKELEDRDRQLHVQTQTIDLLKQEVAQLRNMVSGFGMSQASAIQAMYGRPQHPQQQMNVPMAPQFDSQAAQIAAMGREHRPAPQLPRQHVEAPLPAYSPEQFATAPVMESPAKRRGRPAGSKNKPKTEIT